MRLKEAQLLGVLAIIAGGIIVLSMWSGGSNEENAASQDQASEAASAQQAQPPDIGQVEDWLSQGQRPAPGAPQGANASVRIDGEAQPAPEPASQGTPVASLSPDEITRLLEQHQPQQIALQAQAPSPDAQAAAPAAAAPGAPTVHVVQRGDTLGAISAKCYGSSTKWKYILDANRDLIQKPTDLKPGMKLVIPSLELSPVAPAAAPAAPTGPALAAGAPAPAAAAGPRFYDVQRGDSLWLIAKKVYGNGGEWKKILEANKDLLKTADDLRPDMRLIIP